MDLAILSSAFMLGILGSGHCLGMCGGLSIAFALNSRDQSQSYLLSYHLGRLSSYAVAGLSVGLIGFWFSEYLGLLTSLRFLAAVMLILLGVYIGGWFNALILTEKLGARAWQYIQPLGKRYLPPRSQKQALLLGMVWGWLPCGLVYSALIWAAAQASMINSTLIMMCFGLGTLPSMLGSALLGARASHILRHKRFKQLAGVSMVIIGLGSIPGIKDSLQLIMQQLSTT